MRETLRVVREVIFAIGRVVAEPHCRDTGPPLRRKTSIEEASSFDSDVRSS
jgi:hypothetical protein